MYIILQRHNENKYIKASLRQLMTNDDKPVNVETSNLGVSTIMATTKIAPPRIDAINQVSTMPCENPQDFLVLYSRHGFVHRHCEGEA
jgi:hypothetical protein